MQNYLTGAGRKKSQLSNIDWVSIILYLILVFLGWINIYAAVYNEDHHRIVDLSQRYGKQLMWIILALVLGVIVFLIESKFFSIFSIFIYGGSMLLLIAVLLIGQEIKGAKSWFHIGPFGLQPAEFAKAATALILAKILSEHNFKIHNIQNLIKIGFVMFLPSVLILMQNDTGSALVYFSFILVLFREGLSGLVLFIGLIMIILFVFTLLVGKQLVLFVALGLSIFAFAISTRRYKESFIMAFIVSILSVAIYYARPYIPWDISLFNLLLIGITLSLPFIFYKLYRHKIMFGWIVLSFFIGSIGFTYSVDYVFYNVLEKHQQSRINDLLGIKSDPLGAGYNVAQSKIAIGSGGLTGKGFLRGTQTKFDFVPEQSTDFIFCTVGEEWGFIGTSTTIILFIVFLMRLMHIAERQRSAFSRIYGYGVVSVIFFHVMVNIGMTIGLLPVIGIPLPFFSYGGSSLWGFTILVFILLRLDASRGEYLV